MKLAKMLMALPLLAMAPAVAQAGNKCTSPVFVDPAARTARGALGSARNSADTLQQISCHVYSWGYAFCSARDASSPSKVGSCGTSDPAYVQLLGALNSDSYVSFAWDASGTCTSMVIENTSCLDPKGH